MHKPLVSIIIINFNGGNILDQCLLSLEKLNYKNFEIILVDNGSNESEVEKISKQKNVKFNIILNDKNLGFAPANNQGVGLSKGKYILLLNNDTTVSPDLIDVMVDKMEKDITIGAMQPKIFLMDQKGYMDNAGAFLNTLGFTNHWGFGQKDSDEFNNEREIFSAKGACLFIRKMVIDKIGLFDDDFISYYEESDFCWRVWLSGWRVIYFPETVIFHKGGYTSKNMPVFDINYHSLKNRILSFIKNFNLLNLFIYLPLHVLALFVLMGVYLIKFNFKKINMIICALRWNILHLSDSLEKRKLVQKKRTKTDSDIMPIIMHRLNFTQLIKHFFATEKNFK